MLYIILNESIAFTSEKPSAKRFGLLICEVIPDSITEKAGIIEKYSLFAKQQSLFNGVNDLLAQDFIWDTFTSSGNRG